MEIDSRDLARLARPHGGRNRIPNRRFLRGIGAELAPPALDRPRAIDLAHQNHSGVHVLVVQRRLLIAGGIEHVHAFRLFPRTDNLTPSCVESEAIAARMKVDRGRRPASGLSSSDTDRLIASPVQLSHSGVGTAVVGMRLPRLLVVGALDVV